VDFAATPVFVGKLIDERVGPHPTPMFEINFPKGWFGRVFSWLRANRGELPALVHEVTGDDPKDHSQGAIWLGRVLPLDESRFDPS
jgi:DOPA 4,5-dioxygenase